MSPRPAVKAYFDLQIAQLDLVQKGIDAVADFCAMVADKVMEAVDKIAQAVVSMIPDSWKKAFVDFWNGPWRSVIIIGLATVAAVALTVAHRRYRRRAARGLDRRIDRRWCVLRR